MSKYTFDILSTAGQHDIVVKGPETGDAWTIFATVHFDNHVENATEALMHMLNGVGYDPVTGETDEHKL